MKSYLSTYIEARKLQKPLKSEPTKPSKPGFVGFDGSKISDTSENYQVIKSCPIVCPVCTAKVKREESDAILVLYCPLGCPFVDYTFNEDKEVVYKTVSLMFDRMTFDELTCVSDALGERVSVFKLENGWKYETALREAENDVLPTLLYQFEQSIKLQTAEIKGKK